MKGNKTLMLSEVWESDESNTNNNINVLNSNQIRSNARKSKLNTMSKLISSNISEININSQNDNIDNSNINLDLFFSNVESPRNRNNLNNNLSNSTTILNLNLHFDYTNENNDCDFFKGEFEIFSIRESSREAKFSINSDNVYFDSSCISKKETEKIAFFCYDSKMFKIYIFMFSGKIFECSL